VLERQEHKQRIDSLDSLEDRLIKAVDAMLHKRVGKLGGMIRTQLDEVRQEIRQVKAQVNGTCSRVMDTTSRTSVPPIPAPEQVMATDGATASCPAPCLDIMIPFHESDTPMFVDSGALHSIKTHVKGVRHIHIVSKSNNTFSHLLDNHTFWFDEALAPFTLSDFQSSKPGRHPMGWYYQQTLKLWSAQFLPGACPNLLIIDADNLFLRDFAPVTAVPAPSPGQPCTIKYKYNLSTKESGAMHFDIDSPEYHRFVVYMTGLPKPMPEATAINHWQVMQRDVLHAMARSIKARLGFDSIAAAIIAFAAREDRISEYEAYFSFAWYFYQQRLDVVSMPYVMRQQHMCNYYNETTQAFKEDSIVTYLTCHDNYDGDDHYANCRGREDMCNPRLGAASLAPVVAAPAGGQ
jgi:hypothetical protein